MNCYVKVVLLIVVSVIVNGTILAQSSRRVFQSRQFTELYVKGAIKVECRNNVDSVGLIVFDAHPELEGAVDCHNVGARLSISVEGSSASLQGKISTIVVYYNGLLSTVSYTGSGEIVLSQPPLAQRVAFAMTGSGRMRTIGVKTHYLNCAMAGSGSIAMGAKTIVDNITCSVSGSGAVEVADIQASAANATVNGPGDMIINGRSQKASFALKGSGVIDASALSLSSMTAGVYGSGKIYYNGNVSQVKISGKQDNVIAR